MKTIDPNMNADKQYREAFMLRHRAVAIGDIEMSRYIDDLIWMMACSIAEGLPQPWSQFYPMFQEEFGIE
ncbi:hypothetical protein HWC80_gp047 [Mycobacterium phage Indlulamithi]|uniref:Uncharacterized protein n=1 Tax=Mycobacterium phage Indlulamithi TaxID=2656582 RepID=A0A649VCN5_9CAUD|nr:hypothetical protein HWC80_gp047 [Mycobacterium phage Indlulamithi]QGJ90087.1 hypothetical protein PBI_INDLULAMITHI_47 [Mycobacterium phage Indlulamithi]